jgi:hypothetical protein
MELFLHNKISEEQTLWWNIYSVTWLPSWISDRHKNNKLGRGPPSHHFYDVTIPSAE